MNKLKIGLDVDGVLASFYQEVVKRYNTPEKIKNWFDPASGVKEIWHLIENDNGFWENLPILTPPEQIPFKVDCYITSIPEKMFFARCKWLMKHGYPTAPVYIAEDKLPICKYRKLDYFIDDKPTTVQALNDAGIKCIQFKPWYFTDDIPDAVTSFNEINNIIYANRTSLQ